MLHFDTFLNMTRKRQITSVVFCTMTILWGSVIFNFSAAGGEKSEEQSHGFIQKVFGIFETIGENIKSANVQIDTDEVNNIIGNEPAFVGTELKTTDKEPAAEKEEQQIPVKDIQKEQKNETTQKTEVHTEIGNAAQSTNEPDSFVAQNVDVSENKPNRKNDEVKTAQTQNIVNTEDEKEKIKEKKRLSVRENTSPFNESEQKIEERIKTAVEQNKNIPMFTALNSVVRKAAHICSYVFLAFLAYITVASITMMSKYFESAAWISVPLCVLFAITDEIHQCFVYGRSGKAADVIVDSFGVFAGTLVAFWLVRGFCVMLDKKENKIK